MNLSEALPYADKAINLLLPNLIRGTLVDSFRILRRLDGVSFDCYLRVPGSRKWVHVLRELTPNEEAQLNQWAREEFDRVPG